MSDGRQYKLYFHQTDPDQQGLYRALYVGIGRGNINTGSIVLSNTTTGVGNLTGYIHPQKVAIFQLVGDQNVFVSTDGCQMTFQNIIGKNDLTYIQGFIEYILQRKLQSIQGDEYQGIDKKKAYIVTYTRDDGQTAKATMTNIKWHLNPAKIDLKYNPFKKESWDYLVHGPDSDELNNRHSISEEEYQKNETKIKGLLQHGTFI